MPYVGVVLVGRADIFPHAEQFCREPVSRAGRRGFRGRDASGAASEGSGLNPLLQYPEMVIHPPMLYLGYTGFTVPFAFALAALLGRYPGEKWIHITRRWTMVAWMLSDHRRLARRALGLRRARLGRILGLGSGRKRVAAAVDHGHGFSALGDDAGKARHDESVERVAGIRHVHAVHSGDDAHALRAW